MGDNLYPVATDWIHQVPPVISPSAIQIVSAYFDVNREGRGYELETEKQVVIVASLLLRVREYDSP